MNLYYQIKGNRGLCWIKTLMIAPPPCKLHSLTHTYPITLGHDGDSHEEVELKLAEELLSLGCGKELDFYHGKLKQNIWVHLELFVSLQDQPEWQSAKYIMLGTSSYTACWGLMLDFCAVASGILACSKCLLASLLCSHHNVIWTASTGILMSKVGCWTSHHQRII